MARKFPDSIPSDIYATANRAGLGIPTFGYLGALNDPNYIRKKTFEDLVAEAKDAAKQADQEKTLGEAAMSSEIRVDEATE
jgi:hypothetical protein